MGLVLRFTLAGVRVVVKHHVRELVCGIEARASSDGLLRSEHDDRSPRMSHRERVDLASEAGGAHVLSLPDRLVLQF